MHVRVTGPNHESDVTSLLTEKYTQLQARFCRPRESGNLFLENVLKICFFARTLLIAAESYYVEEIVGDAQGVEFSVFRDDIHTPIRENDFADFMTWFRMCGTDPHCCVSKGLRSLAEGAPMRQHIINSSNVYGIQASNVSAVAIVAARDVVMHQLRSWKPLSKCKASSSKWRSKHSDVPGVVRTSVVGTSVDPVVVHTTSVPTVSTTETVRTPMTPPVMGEGKAASRCAGVPAAARAMAWPAVNFEPPAAAWARLVIGREISI